MTRRALVVDDDAAVRTMVGTTLRKIGFAVDVAASAEEAWATFELKGPDVVVSDIYLGGATGIALLERIASSSDRVPVILMTARGSVESAAIAQRVGAFDYIAKPFDLATLVDRVNAAVQAPAVSEAAILDLPESVMTGAHPAMVEVYKAIARAAPLDIPVLILGETGTGKELAARAIHMLSPRAGGPFVVVNCGAIPDTLFESELFGFVRGAFTDARRDRIGALAGANGGTLFLDEIGDIALASQVKLLRFLQDRNVRPLGADKGEPVDVRIVAATNRPLPRLAGEDRFRRDLYYRLAGWEIQMPPLRERRSDIELLVETFRRHACDEMKLVCGGASRDVLDVLERHDWPGNVRELGQVVRRLVIESGGLTDAHAAARIVRGISPDSGAEAPEQPARMLDRAAAPGRDAILMPLEEIERTHILAVLAAAGGNRTRAAEILGIERRTLARKLKLFGGEGIAIGDTCDSEEDV